MNQLRAHLPLLLALSASSPLLRGRATGLASNRTIVFQGFPRTGIPRRFDGYGDWVATVDLLLRSGAIPEPTFLWWDVRPQPRLGTVEVRIMDAQPRLASTAALVALVQALARLELEQGFASPQARLRPGGAGRESVHRGARRHGGRADRPGERRRWSRWRACSTSVLAAARPHAVALDAVEELDEVRTLVLAPEPRRQERLAASAGDPDAGRRPGGALCRLSSLSRSRRARRTARPRSRWRSRTTCVT